jgi:CRISPR-associated endoribonuclease Cas6
VTTKVAKPLNLSARSLWPKTSELFLSQKKRKGGNRAQDTAQKWATILARREQGDRLDAIASDMDIPYETAKTYSKLARRALKDSELN